MSATPRRPEFSKWVVDECPDAGGFSTIRIADGTPNGNIEVEPIATVYEYDVACLIVAQHNHSIRYIKD